jgi:hypothetical protein
MSQPLFIAVEPFDPSDGENWRKYFRWAEIPALREVITLDLALCPRLITKIKREDRDHNVNENRLAQYFYDLAYLQKRVANISRKHILGVYRNPEMHIEQPPAINFNFVGYDLIEEATQISALTNCGGFPETFSKNELNCFGLIDTFDRAAEIHHDLPERNPSEPHAKCELYAIWLLMTPTATS